MQKQINSRQDLKAHLRRKELAPVYVLFGEESYLKELAADTIARIALKGSSLIDFNDTETSLSQSSLTEALALADQLPMMDPRRVVRITDVVVSGTKSKDTLKEDDADTLERYLTNPCPTTVLVIIADELDRRRKLSKLLLENSFPVEFGRLTDQELLIWAKNRLREGGAEADENALQAFVARIGNDVRKLGIELEKLITAALPDKVVTQRLVESLTPYSREVSNFELVDQMLAKNRPRALRVMKKILDDGAEPLMLLGLLSYNFHRLFLAKEMMNEGVDRKEVSRVVRMPFRKQKSFLETARRTDRKTLSFSLKRIADTDLAIKTSVANPRLQIEMLICELASV